MNAKIISACTALCAAAAMFCLAGCRSSDPVVVYKKAYARIYKEWIDQGMDPKMADELAKGTAASIVAELNPTPGAPDLGVALIRPSDDLLARAAALQAGGPHAPVSPPAVHPSTVGPTMPAGHTH